MYVYAGILADVLIYGCSLLWRLVGTRRSA